MGDVTAHRGPDDEGQHIDGACGIAMRRLSIIDLAGGHQPLSTVRRHGTGWCATAKSTTTANCASRTPGARGFQFKTGSDSEVLLHGYEARR